MIITDYSIEFETEEEISNFVNAIEKSIEWNKKNGKQLEEKLKNLEYHELSKEEIKKYFKKDLTN